MFIVLFGGDENVLELGRGDVCNNITILNT